MMWVGEKMPSDKKRRVAKVLALTVILSAVLVIIGWIFDIGILKSLSPSWISMKFDTAVAFLLSGISLYFMARAMAGEFDLSQIVLSVTALIIMLFMGTMLFASLFSIHTGIEDLFIKETPGALKTITPGRPALLTMLNFILVAFAGVMTITNFTQLEMKLKVIGVVIGAIGALAAVGYLIHVPLLYYYIEGVSTAMACNTAVLFVLLGIGFVCLSE
jgi:hypothetical protein